MKYTDILGVEIKEGDVVTLKGWYTSPIYRIKSLKENRIGLYNYNLSTKTFNYYHSRYTSLDNGQLLGVSLMKTLTEDLEKAIELDNEALFNFFENRKIVAKEKKKQKDKIVTIEGAKYRVNDVFTTYDNGPKEESVTFLLESVSGQNYKRLTYKEFLNL